MSAGQPEVGLIGEGSVLREWTAGDLAAMTGMFDDPEDLQDSGRVAVRPGGGGCSCPSDSAGSCRWAAGLHLAITVDGGRPGADARLDDPGAGPAHA